MKNARKFGIFQNTVKVVYKYNECFINGDSKPKKSFSLNADNKPMPLKDDLSLARF